MSKRKNNKPQNPSLLSPEIVQEMEQALAATGFELTYTPRSLLRLERVVNQMFPKEGPSRLTTAYLPFGYYLGETIRRNIPEAKWVDNDDPFEISVTIPVKNIADTGTAHLKPFIRVYKFFTDRSEGLKPLYDLANLSNLGMLGNIDPRNIPADELGKWKNFPNGMQFRIMQADADPRGETPDAENEPEK